MLERSVLSRVLPFGAYISFLFLSDVLAKFGLEAQDLRWLYSVKIAVVVWLLWVFRAEYSELSWPSKSTRTWVIAVITGAAVFFAWISLNADWMLIGTPTSYNPFGGSGVDWVLVVVRLVGAALVVPLMEELFWRSFLMRWICDQNFRMVEPAVVGVRAFAITTVFFAVEHNFWLAGIVAGMAYGLLYMGSGTLWSPIIAHAVTNGMLGVWVLYTGNWAYW